MIRNLTCILLFYLVATITGAASPKFYPVNLRSKATTGIADSVENDYMGGWFDQGNNDLRNFPSGKIKFRGVPFDIINPAKNNEAVCIVLRGNPRPYFPGAVKNISVKRNGINYLYFLQTSGWGSKQLQGKEVFNYSINYDDGTKKTIPVKYGVNIANWWVPEKLSAADIAWVGYNPVKRLVGVWIFAWKNPFPAKKIKSIDINGGQTTVIPAVLGITAQTGGDKSITPVNRKIRLKVALDSTNYTNVPAQSHKAGLKHKISGSAEKLNLQIEKAETKLAEYKILNNLYEYKARQFVAEKRIPATALKTPLLSKQNASQNTSQTTSLAILNADFQPELQHFLKHISLISGILKNKQKACKKITIQQLLSGELTAAKYPILIYPQGDPFPFTKKTKGDCFKALESYLASGGAVLNINNYPFGRELNWTDGKWKLERSVSRHSTAVKARHAFPKPPAAKAQIYLKNLQPQSGLPKKIHLPNYAFRGYRILDERILKYGKWKCVPIVDIYTSDNNREKRIGCGAAILYSEKGKYKNSYWCWIDPAILKYIAHNWKNSIEKKLDGARKHQKSRNAEKLLLFCLENIRKAKKLIQNSGKIAENAEAEKLQAQLNKVINAELLAEKRYNYLRKILSQSNHERKVPAITIKDGMFLINGQPKVLWGTEISGYRGGGGNGVTAPLGKHYLDGCELFDFDYTVLTVYPILPEINGIKNPRAIQFKKSKRNAAAELSLVARKAAKKGWPLELNSTVHTYNSFIKKAAPELFPKNSYYQCLVGSPEKDLTRQINRKLYKWMLDCILPANNLAVIELDNESLYISYSKENIATFREWLKQKYGSIDKLNAVWESNTSNFAQLEAPALKADYARKHGIAPIVDWIKFQQKCYVEVIKWKKSMLKKLLRDRKVYFSIQPFATMTGGEHRHSYAMRGTNYEDIVPLADIMSNERLFAPLLQGVSADEVARMIGNAGFMFTDLLRSITNCRKPIVNTEGALIKYGGRKTAAEYNLGVWAHIVHGDQAVVPTYWGWFPAADSVVYPANNEEDVLTQMAKIGRQLKKHSAVLAPVPRIQGKIAMLASFAAMRDIRRSFSPETYYYAGIFSRRPLDIITGRQILKNKLKQYKLLILPGCHLVEKDVYEAIVKYIKDGGIVIADTGTFRGDEYGKPLNTKAFFPLNSKLNLLDNAIIARGHQKSTLNWNAEKLPLHFADKTATLTAGKVLAQNDNGKPGIAMRAVGKGRVYQIAGTTGAKTTLKIVKNILDLEKISKNADAHGIAAECFVETQLIPRKGCILLWAGNYFSNAQKIKVIPLIKLDTGKKYQVSSLVNDQKYKAPSNTKDWSADELRKGITLMLNKHGCELLKIKALK